MQRILLTGMSGVGKSTLVAELSARGFKAVDADDPAWSEWRDSPDGEGPTPLQPGKDWVWREDRIQSLLSAEDADVLFVSGCAPNQAGFHDQFDHIVLLSAPAPVMVERLSSRRANSYGHHPEEVARSVHFKDTVEPRLRAIADLEVDTSAPVEDVLRNILTLVR